ncbi:MAG: DUF998 domain-containing protein [Promethearchaeota archaeon]|nr:MAG: DUF998 domain-containing protein [Candidatus Lokiarchaeota archaeon]
MQKLNSMLDKFTKKISGGVYGLLSITFGIIGDLLAYLMYPGYDFLRMPVSSLCDGRGGLFFQIGTVFSGIWALFFLIYISQTFDGKKNSENLTKVAVYFALISCISFIGLGAFCGSNPTIALIHGICTIISWLSGICYLTLFSILMLRDSKYSKFLVYVGFSAAISLSTMVIMFFLYYFPGLQNLIIILPLWEWIDTFVLIIWYFVVSLYLLIKKIKLY